MINRDANDDHVTAGRHGFRFSLRALLILVILASFLVGGAVWVKKKFDDLNVAMLVGDPGPVKTQERWPRVLKDLVHEAAEKQITVEILDVHCIQSGWDEEFVWRMKSNPSLIGFMEKHYEIVPTDPPQWSIFGSKSFAYVTKRQIPPWPLPELEKSNYYACPRFIAREPPIALK